MPLTKETIETMRDPNSVSLVLDNQNLNDKDIKELVEAWPDNCKITAIYCSNNLLTDAGVALLAKLPLSALDLSNNRNITSASATSLVNCKTLEVVNLAHNNIDDAGVIHLAENSNITSLNLSYNFVTSVGAMALLKNQRLTALGLVHNMIKDEGLDIPSDSKLKNLNLAENEISSQGIRNIKNNSNLQRLNLSTNLINDEGASYIMQNSYIRILDLSLNQITDKGAKLLAQNSVINELNLFGNKITSEGAQGLANNQTINILNLGKNSITDEGAKALAKNETITTLNLSKNSITNEGAKALAQNQSIINLNLAENKIKNEGAAAFSKNCAVKDLNLSANILIETEEVGSKFAKNLSENNNLCVLDLSDNNINNKNALCDLVKISNLETLNLSSNNILRAGVEAILKTLLMSEISRLQKVNLSKNELSADNIRDLATILSNLLQNSGNNISALAVPIRINPHAFFPAINLQNDINQNDPFVRKFEEVLAEPDPFKRNIELAKLLTEPENKVSPVIPSLKSLSLFAFKKHAKDNPAQEQINKEKLKEVGGAINLLNEYEKINFSKK